MPPKLVVAHPGGKHYVLLTKEAKILRRHIDPLEHEDKGDEVMGQVAQSPGGQHIWGIRNLSPTPWVATATDGRVVEVVPQKAVPMGAGLKVNIGGTQTEIMA